MKLSGNNKVSSPKTASLPINYEFLNYLKTYIEEYRTHSSHIPSIYYSPSSLNCIRQMYYKRTGTNVDIIEDNYSSIGMADTGTRRHEAIQDVLVYMNSKHSRFLYIDVDRFISERQKRGKCLTLQVKGKCGAETAVFDTKRNVSFRVDGIIYDIRNKQFYLFEFKNQISFKASKKSEVDQAHKNQVHCYCALLELDKALVVYENRDNCELYCPEVLEVTDYEKLSILNLLDKCESFVNENKVPPVPEDVSNITCNYCNYKSTCRQDLRGGV